jgi:type III pantothenate kinase
MGKINLCIDIGNTSTKGAVYSNGKEVDYIKPFTADHLKQLQKENEVDILVSKTGSNPELEELLNANSYLSHETSLPIKLDYKTPQTLGRDRIATAVGAYTMDEDSAWLIIDLGTCLTIDLLHNDTFYGGLISPGVPMRLKAMNEFTAGLPLVDYNYEVQFPGKTTEESLQVGVCQSIFYEIKGYIRQMNQQFNDLKIVDCSSVKLHFDKEVKNEIFARPKLVVQGLNNIIEYNAKK